MREQQSRQVFQAYVQNKNDTAYLRTGDLGWMDQGRLYVSGRLKELLIINGRNYAPQDIEETAEAECAALRQAGAVVFAVGGEGAWTGLSSSPNSSAVGCYANPNGRHWPPLCVRRFMGYMD